jgi:PST family polysaccharide transporter
MVLFRLFDRSLGIVSTMILARLLIPADFGLVAMAMSVIAIVELATTFNFELALIQKADPVREHFDTAWTLNILIALGGALLTAALAYPAASFYGDPRLVSVMLAIGAAWLVSGFENTGIANFRRQMDFWAEFRWMASKRVASFIVTMIAALAFRSYWALVVGMVTGRDTGVVMSYAMHPFRPRFALSRARAVLVFRLDVGHQHRRRCRQPLPHIYVGRVFPSSAARGLHGRLGDSASGSHRARRADQSGNVSRLCATGRRP